jgi:hypothetical protein
VIERILTAVRYITPFRQGGSVPALIEADDGELYVLKFHAAAQGRRALVAELIAGEIGRRLGLRVPELAFIRVEPNFGMSEAHAEIRDLLNASAGLNLGLRFLPDSLEYNPLLTPPPEPDEAAAIVWFDAYVTNVDRTLRNVNMLLHERRLWLIDHGSALYFHHSRDWTEHPERALAPFALIKDHALLPVAGSVTEADRRLRPMLPQESLDEIVALLPEAWLVDGAVAAELRGGYARWLTDRLAAAEVFVEEAENARARRV